MSTAGARDDVGTPAPGPFPIEGYRFIERIAVGGMGEVYLAEDIGLRRHVAIKIMPAVLRSDPECKLRFRREAEALGRLSHPHVCPVLAAGEEQGVPYYVMEYLGGLDLRTVVRTQRMDASRAAEIGEQIAGALGFAHRHGIVHRDFKPSNVMILRTDRRRAAPTAGRTGSTWVKSALRMLGVGDEQAPAPDGDEARFDPRRPKLPSPIYHDHAYVIDFGLAHLEGAEGLTRTGDLIGTPHYMAPEMADGDRRRVGPPADVFAAGITLYEALTGRLPFAGDDPLAVMEKIRHDDPTPIRRLRPETPRDLAVIVAKCLEKDPKRRYPDGDALAQDLRRFRAGEPIEARPASLLYRATNTAKRHREMVVTAAVALAIAAATALWLGVVAPWRAAQARRAEAAPIVDRIGRLEREARERLERAGTLEDCDAFLDWHEREGAPFARDFGLADIGHKSYAAIPMPEVWALRADLHERQGDSRAALGAAARAWWSLQHDPRGPDAPRRDVTLRYLRALHDEGATRTALEMARAWPADELDDAVLDLWARAALAERQHHEAAAAAARLRGGPAAYRRALTASIPRPPRPIELTRSNDEFAWFRDESNLYVLRRDGSLRLLAVEGDVRERIIDPWLPREWIPEVDGWSELATLRVAGSDGVAIRMRDRTVILKRIDGLLTPEHSLTAEFNPTAVMARGRFRSPDVEEWVLAAEGRRLVFIPIAGGEPVYAPVQSDPAIAQVIPGTPDRLLIFLGAWSHERAMLLQWEPSRGAFRMVSRSAERLVAGADYGSGATLFGDGLVHASVRDTSQRGWQTPMHRLRSFEYAADGLYRIRARGDTVEQTLLAPVVGRPGEGGAVVAPRDEETLFVRICRDSSFTGRNRGMIVVVPRNDAPFARVIWGDAADSQPRLDLVDGALRLSLPRAFDGEADRILAAARAAPRSAASSLEGLLREWLLLGLETEVIELGSTRYAHAPSAELGVVLGDACAASGRTAEAVEWYERAVAADPAAHGHLLERAAQMRLREWDFAGAQAALDRCAELSSPGARRASMIDAARTAVRSVAASPPLTIDWREGDLLVDRPLLARVEGADLRFLACAPGVQIRVPLISDLDAPSFAISLEGAVATPEWARAVHVGVDSLKLQLFSRGSTNLPMVHVTADAPSLTGFEAASISEGTVTAMRLCAFPPMGISGLRVEQGDASEALWARHVPPIGREPIALSITTGHRTDLLWSTLLRSEGRLWSATIRSRAFSRAQVDRTRWVRELAGGLLVQGRNVEAAAAFEALGDRLHAAVARFRAGLPADLAGAIRDAPFESLAYLALARPLLSDAEREWIRGTVETLHALPPPPEWAPDWALLFGGDETAALVEQIDYAAMRLRFEEVERILAASDDPSVRTAGAAAYLQTWSDRVDVARAEALLGAEPAEGMRAMIDLESGRYGEAAERYARLAARAHGAAKQTLWWQHDEARLRAGDEY